MKQFYDLLRSVGLLWATGIVCDVAVFAVFADIRHYILGDVVHVIR